MIAIGEPLASAAHLRVVTGSRLHVQAMSSTEAPAGRAGPAHEASDKRRRAEESVATRFSRLMNATTTPLGVFTDPPVVAAATAPLFLGYLALLRLDLPSIATRAALGLLLAPLAVALVLSLVIRGARARLIDWLAAKPFPVENMNAVLNGLGELLEVEFDAEPPEQAEVNRALEAVSPDAFVTEREPESRRVKIRVGVVDSKYNPAASNHARFVRVQRIVDEVLVPLSSARPIVAVRIE